jgi:hypothetical protein
MENIEYENLSELINEGQLYLDELKTTLKDIKVPVSSLHPTVIEAIRNIFGDNYLNSEGKGFITYEMYLKSLDIIRSVGNATASEFV